MLQLLGGLGVLCLLSLMVWAYLGCLNRKDSCFGPSCCLLGLVGAHKCSFQLGGITGKTYQPGITLRLLWMAVRGKEEPHLKLWQSCLVRALTHKNSWTRMERRGNKEKIWVHSWVRRQPWWGHRLHYGSLMWIMKSFHLKWKKNIFIF